MLADVVRKFQQREAQVAVVGLGYAGLPIAVAFAECGYHVTGIDIDAAKVGALNRGVSYVEDIPDAALGPLVCGRPSPRHDGVRGTAHV
ncbi:MAG: 3-hydroxyacyl-CoA dehydrogenase NAD-binding domain-containing protein [Caldilineaceae bacterium]